MLSRHVILRALVIRYRHFRRAFRMNLIKLTLLLVVVVIFSIACNKPSSPTTNNGPAATSPPATATPDEFAGARASFAKNCVPCHGPKAEGGPVTVEGHKLK